MDGSGIFAAKKKHKKIPQNSIRSYKFFSPELMTLTRQMRSASPLSYYPNVQTFSPSCSPNTLIVKLSYKLLSSAVLAVPAQSIRHWPITDSTTDCLRSMTHARERRLCHANERNRSSNSRSNTFFYRKRRLMHHHLHNFKCVDTSLYKLRTLQNFSE